MARGLKVAKAKKGRKGRPPVSTSFKPGHAAYHRGPDIRPRTQVVALAQLNALFAEQIRDPRTGRISKSKWTKGVLSAGYRDFIRAHVRLFYAMAHGNAAEAAQLASAVTKTGDYLATHLDNKPAASPRVTIFNIAPGKPNTEIPTQAGQLSTAEEGYVDVGEEDVPT